MKNRLNITWMLGCIALVLCSLLVTLYAQDNRSRTSTSAYSIKRIGTANTVSASKSRVTLRLTFDTGTVFKVTQFVGKAIRVEHKGSLVAIVPHIDSKSIDHVMAKIFKMLPEQAGGEPLGESMGEMRLSSPGEDSGESGLSNLGFKLEVLGFSLESELEDRIKLSSFPLRQGGGADCICCVTCNGTRVCGCAVESDCGSCCCGVCCGTLL